jgi:hypothetical protein
MSMESGRVGKLSPAGLLLAYMFYERQVSLALRPAVKDGAIGKLAGATSSSLRYTDSGSVDEQQQSSEDVCRSSERLHDPKDVKLKLCELVQGGQLTSVQPIDAGVSGASTQFRAVLNSNCVVVLELALVINDAGWSPSNTYIVVEIDGVGGAHRCARHTLGDATRTLARCAAQAYNEYHRVDLKNGDEHAETVPRLCAISRHRNISGWCQECGQRPNKLTLHQSVLDPTDVFRFMPEVISATGTHGHIVDAPHVTPSDRLGSRRVQLSLDSTIAQDLCRDGRACHDTSSFADSSDGSIYVDAAEWNASVERVADSILVNIPLANLDTATIRLAARTDTQRAASGSKLHVTLIAQCVGYVVQ